MIRVPLPFGRRCLPFFVSVLVRSILIFSFYLLVLSLAVVPFARAYVGDGACDSSDLLKHSPDCSAAVYVLTPAGGPLESVQIYHSDSRSAIIPVVVKNFDPQRDAYVCFTASGRVTLFDRSGDTNTLCFAVPASGQTTLMIGLKYSGDVLPDSKAGEVIIATSYYSRTVDVYVITPSFFDFLSDPHVATASSVLVFAFLAIVLYSLTRR